MIYVSLGANVPSRAGPPAHTLRAAIEAMRAQELGILAVSPFYASIAWPNPQDPPFVNAMVNITTRRGPHEVLQTLLATERQFGRVRKTRWEPRCLDLDLIDYGGLVLDTEVLSLPHPRLHERGFVLRPLKDLNPSWRHPDTGEEVGRLLEIAGEDGVVPLVDDQKKG